MSEPCIGWETDEPCPTYGQFHGCEVPIDTHGGRHHRCVCGVLNRAQVPRKRGPARDPALGCGTNAGYHRHVRAGEPACHYCKSAHAAYVDERKKRRIA